MGSPGVCGSVAGGRRGSTVAPLGEAPPNTSHRAIKLQDCLVAAGMGTGRPWGVATVQYLPCWPAPQREHTSRPSLRGTATCVLNQLWRTANNLLRDPRQLGATERQDGWGRCWPQVRSQWAAGLIRGLAVGLSPKQLASRRRAPYRRPAGCSLCLAAPRRPCAAKPT